MTVQMSPEDLTRKFTHPDGFYCARWRRPIAPVVFGAADDTVAVFKGAAEALCTLTGHRMAELDGDMGTNLFVFLCADWMDLEGVPDLDKLVGDADLPARLSAANASQTRLLRYDADGSIRAAFIFLRVVGDMADVPADLLALDQICRVMLSWGPDAFAVSPPMVRAADKPAMLRPDIARLLRAAYDPTLPVAASDASHALRLFARMEGPDA